MPDFWDLVRGTSGEGSGSQDGGAGQEPGQTAPERESRASEFGGMQITAPSAPTGPKEIPILGGLLGSIREDTPVLGGFFKAIGESASETTPEHFSAPIRDLPLIGGVSRALLEAPLNVLGEAAKPVTGALLGTGTLAGLKAGEALGVKGIETPEQYVERQRSEIAKAGKQDDIIGALDVLAEQGGSGFAGGASQFAAEMLNPVYWLAGDFGIERALRGASAAAHIKPLTELSVVERALIGMPLRGELTAERIGARLFERSGLLPKTQASELTNVIQNTTDNVATRLQQVMDVPDASFDSMIANARDLISGWKTGQMEGALPIGESALRSKWGQTVGKLMLGFDEEKALDQARKAHALLRSPEFDAISEELLKTTGRSGGVGAAIRSASQMEARTMDELGKAGVFGDVLLWAKREIAGAADDAARGAIMQQAEKHLAELAQAKLVSSFTDHAGKTLEALYPASKFHSAETRVVRGVTEVGAASFRAAHPNAILNLADNIIKPAMSAVVLGLNPYYAMRNAWNNVSTMAARGTLGFWTPDRIAKTMVEFGVKPGRFGSGYGIAGAKGFGFQRLAGWIEGKSSEMAYAVGASKSMRAMLDNGKAFHLSPEFANHLRDVDPSGGLERRAVAIIKEQWGDFSKLTRSLDELLSGRPTKAAPFAVDFEALRAGLAQRISQRSGENAGKLLTSDRLAEIWNDIPPAIREGLVRPETLESSAKQLFQHIDDGLGQVRKTTAIADQVPERWGGGAASRAPVQDYIEHLKSIATKPADFVPDKELARTWAALDQMGFTAPVSQGELARIGEESGGYLRRLETALRKTRIAPEWGTPEISERTTFLQRYAQERGIAAPRVDVRNVSDWSPDVKTAYEGWLKERLSNKRIRIPEPGDVMGAAPETTAPLISQDVLNRMSDPERTAMVKEMVAQARAQGKPWVDALEKAYQERAAYVARQFAAGAYQPDKAVAMTERMKSADAIINLLSEGKRGLNYDELATTVTSGYKPIGEYVAGFARERGVPLTGAGARGAGGGAGAGGKVRSGAATGAGVRAGGGANAVTPEAVASMPRAELPQTLQRFSQALTVSSPEAARTTRAAKRAQEQAVRETNLAIRNARFEPAQPGYRSAALSPEEQAAQAAFESALGVPARAAGGTPAIDAKKAQAVQAKLLKWKSDLDGYLALTPKPGQELHAALTRWVREGHTPKAEFKARLIEGINQYPQQAQEIQDVARYLFERKWGDSAEIAAYSRVARGMNELKILPYDSLTSRIQYARARGKYYAIIDLPKENVFTWYEAHPAFEHLVGIEDEIVTNQLDSKGARFVSLHRSDGTTVTAEELAVFKRANPQLQYQERSIAGLARDNPPTQLAGGAPTRPSLLDRVEAVRAANAMPETTPVEIQKKIEALAQAGLARDNPQIQRLAARAEEGYRGVGVTAESPTIGFPKMEQAWQARAQTYRDMVDLLRTQAGGWQDAAFAGGDLTLLHKELYGNIFPALNDAKLAALKMGEWYRDAALLNYSSRYGFDSFSGVLFPYEFFFTHSLVNWGTYFADNPGRLALYVRLREMLRDKQQEDGFPERFRGTIPVPLPFVPAWLGGGVGFVDPLNTALPIEQMMGSLKNLAFTRSNDHDVALKVRQMARSGEVSPEEAEAAISKRAGTLWELAKQRVGEMDQNPYDIASLTLSPSLPIDWIAKMMTGKPEEIRNILPLSGLIQSGSAALKALGVGGIPAGGVKVDPVGVIKERLLNAPYDQWENYRVDRALASMVADGRITLEQMKRTRLERSGQVFDEALQRAALEQGVGDVTGLTGARAKALPSGEWKTYETNAQYRTMIDALTRTAGGDPDKLSYAEKKELLKKSGDWEKTVSPWFEAHPEYIASIVKSQEPEALLRSVYVDEIWKAYNGMSALDKRLAKQQNADLGKFIDPKTRLATEDYPLTTLLKLDLFLQGYVPKVAPGLVVNPPPDVTAVKSAGLATVPSYVSANPAWAKAYAQRDAKVQSLGGWEKIGQWGAQYGTLSTSADKRAFIESNPRYKVYLDYEHQWIADNPTLAQKLGLKVSITGATSSARDTYAGYGAAPAFARTGGGGGGGGGKRSFTPSSNQSSGSSANVAFTLPGGQKVYRARNGSLYVIVNGQIMFLNAPASYTAPSGSSRTGSRPTFPAYARIVAPRRY